MAKAIRVPAGFREDFDFYCNRAGIVGAEREFLRDEVRKDFETVGRWVMECATLYRFIDETWFGAMPTPEMCKGYLASKGVFYEDESIFQRYGILLQVRLCARAAGVLPGEIYSVDPRNPT